MYCFIMTSRKYLMDSRCFQKAFREVFYARKLNIEFSVFKKALSHKCKVKFSTKVVKDVEHKDPNSEQFKTVQKTGDLATELTKWAMQCNISHIAFSKLLKILAQNGLETLPKNSKDLLKAKEYEIVTSSVPPGVYAHYGLEKNLKKLISHLAGKCLLNNTNINVSIFIDHLLLSKVTHHGLWTILGSIVGFNKTIFLIGAYFGYSKPSNANLFLKEFVEESKNLCSTGLIIDNNKYTLTIKRIICDAPAKAFVLNIKHFLGYSSCIKCYAKGEYNKNKICFPEKCHPKLDQDFHENEIYQKEKTKLLEIPNFGVVSNVPFDYLHLVCLGVLKKLITTWVKNNKNYWNNYNSLTIKKNFSGLNPLEFKNKSKPLCFIERWTSSDLRQFLLYHGPVLLKGTLKKEYYDHFLSLHAACRIFCMTESKEESIDLGQQILDQFIENLKILYGKEHMTHNVHGLYHLADDCKLHGTLDSFSAFPYEMFLQKLKKSIRKHRKKSLPQMILKNSHENIFMKSLQKLNSENLKALEKLKVSEKDHNSEFQSYIQYKKLKFKNKQIVPQKNGNEFVLLNNKKIVEVKNILMRKEKSSRSLWIAGKEFLSVSSFYSEPIDSLHLDVFSVTNVSETLKIWPVDMIKKKCIKIPKENDGYVIIALLDEDF